MHRRDLLKLAIPAVIPAAWAQEVSKPTWRPAVLDAHENETVIALTDLIIPATDTPGAKVARVNRYIDLLLKDGTPEQRDRFLGGLAWLDAHAIAHPGQPFVKCTPAEQMAMLKTFDEGAGPGHAFFGQIKSLTAKIYYATEIGFQELNKGGRVPASFGCAHGSHG